MIRSLLAWLRRFWIVLAVLVGLLLGYTLAGFWLVPHLARKAIQDYATRIGCQATLGEFAFNPFTFELQAGPFTLTEQNGAPLVAFKTLHVNVEPVVSILERAIVLQALSLTAPDIALVVETDGSVNLARLAPPDESPKTETTALPRLHIGVFGVEEGRLAIEDRSRPKPFVTVLSPIRFALADFRTDLGHENGYQFSGKTSADEQIDWSGGFTVQPLGSSGQFAVKDLQSETIASYLQDQLPMQLTSGVADLGGSYQLTLDPVLALDIRLPAVTVRELAFAERDVAGAGAPVNITELGLQDVALSLGKREVTVAGLRISGARVTAQRELDGSLSLTRLFATKPAKASTAKPASEKEGGWRVGVDVIEIKEGDIVFEDRSVKPAARFSLAPVAASMKGFSTDLSAPLAVTADLGINKSGRLRTHGELQLQPLSAKLALDLQNFALPVLQSYLQETTTLTLQSGLMGIKGDLGYISKPGIAPQLSFRGALDVSGFNSRDPAAGQDLIKWRQLNVSDIDFRQAPDRLTINQVTLREPYARVVIQADRTLNLTQVLRSQATATEKGGAAPASAGTTQGEANSKPNMLIRVKTISVENGTTDFADLSIEPQFAAAILGLKGSVTGVSSDPASRARIALEGSVDKYAPVIITGEANLLAATQYSNIAMSFRNMELTTFNPYSGRYAGYNITKGKLTTELKYKVQNRQLEAEHHVVLDQLEFGEATGSKQKVPLPIKLAVALLKDRQGVIDIQLPVRGSLDDPTFRIGPIVWQAFINLLTKAVTAPFALLGSLFGGGEQLSYVDFAPGSASLVASETDKLKKLAAALVERPQLKLDVPLTLAEAQDRQAMARAALDQLVPPLASTEDSGKTDKTRLRALESAFVRLTNETLVYPPETATDKQKEIQVKIDYLEKTLIARLAPNTAVLEQLAKARAQAVQTALLTGTPITPERIFITARRSTAATEAGNVRMELKLE
jgi:hypothetical protein